jgi:hypothetical protein
VRQHRAAQGGMGQALEGRDYRAFHELDSLFPLIPRLMDYCWCGGSLWPNVKTY